MGVRPFLWAIVPLASACSGGASDPVTEQRTWDGDFLVDQVVLDCNGVNEWTYDVWTLGWGDEVTVEVVADGFGYRWREQHALSEVDYGEDWAHFQVTLDQAYYEEDYASSESTLIACEAKTFVTWAIATWRYDGELQECIAYGVDPEGVFPTCANWGQGH